MKQDFAGSGVPAPASTTATPTRRSEAAHYIPEALLYFNALQALQARLLELLLGLGFAD